MRLFDTHCHLLDARFDEDRDAVLRRMQCVGVERALEACTELGDIPGLLKLVAETPLLCGSIGIHPHTANTWNATAAAMAESALVGEKIVAVGEIGLDYHYEFSPREVQRRCFADQLELATAHSLPVLIHDREAHGDTMDILRAHRQGLRGVMHCFAGSYETARECVDLGLYIAFGGSCTFKNAERLRDAARRLPLDRLLIETDCPYMTPVPLRGQRNEPSYMTNTLAVLAELRAMDSEELAAILWENSHRMLGVTLCP